MKNIALLSSLGLILLSLIFTNGQGGCYFIQRKFRVCKNLENLVSVEETNKDKESNLRHPLHIIDKKISAIHPNVFKNITIYHLILEFAEGQLYLEEKSFTGLSQLRILEFFSGIVTLQDNLFRSVRSLTKLTLIIDGKNKNFKYAFPELLYLNVLRVFDSNIGNLTANVFKFFYPPINGLELIRNNISYIKPNSFIYMWSLKILKIQDNELTNLSPGTFSDLFQLESLTISWNKLSVIHSNTFNNLKRLKELYIVENLIDTIATEAFKGLNLTILDLSKNKIFTLQPEVFRGLTTESLDLSGNKILEICNGGFSISNIKKLYLPGTCLPIMRQSWGLGNSTNIFIDGKII